ncbi:MAG: AI-2E family transporter [Legionellales bacterium]
MLTMFQRFYKRNFSNPEAVVLALFLVVGFFLCLVFGEIMASVITALIIAFLLEAVIRRLGRLQVKRGWALAIVYLGFLGLLTLVLFGLIPLLLQQVFRLLEESPQILSNWQSQLLLLPSHYPDLVSEQQINDFIASTSEHVRHWGQHILTYSTALVPIVAAIVVYFVLVPLMVFFMLKDRNLICDWFANFLPKDRGLVNRVWDEVHTQLGNYVLGKVGEMLIIGVSSWILFVIMGLHYAALMAVVIGISILIPYIGAAIASIPLILIAFFQWGVTPHFVYFLVAYGVLLAIDGNVLVPLLFAEVVNIHPLAIIIAIIFFGGLWGFWGVFFAIPLGILIKAVINAWPEHHEQH